MKKSWRAPFAKEFTELALINCESFFHDFYMPLYVSSMLRI